MPSASVKTAVNVNPGVFLNCLNANCTSCINRFIAISANPACFPTNQHTHAVLTSCSRNVSLNILKQSMYIGHRYAQLHAVLMYSDNYRETRLQSHEATLLTQPFHLIRSRLPSACAYAQSLSISLAEE